MVRGKLWAIKRKIASLASRVTPTMHFASIKSLWVVHGALAWITLKPGSRPRRTARGLVVWAAARLGMALDHIPDPPSLDARYSERERFVHAKLSAALEKRLG